MSYRWTVVTIDSNGALVRCREDFATRAEAEAKRKDWLKAWGDSNACVMQCVPDEVAS